MSPDAQALRADLQTAGLRVTPTRLAVLAILRSAEHSLTHQEIARLLQGDGCDPTTVYRSLVALVDAGLALRADVGDHVWRFQAATDDARPHEHPHFVCVECGGVECMPDVEVKVPRGSRVPRSVERQVVDVQVRGRCDNCS